MQSELKLPETMQITLLGATGSIGTSTLDVVSRNPERYQIYALTAHTSVEKMLSLCERWSPRFAVMSDESAAGELRNSLQGQDIQTEVLSGESGLLRVVQDKSVDCVVAAIVGAAGLGDIAGDGHQVRSHAGFYVSADRFGQVS